MHTHLQLHMHIYIYIYIYIYMYTSDGLRARERPGNRKTSKPSIVLCEYMALAIYSTLRIHGIYSTCKQTSIVLANSTCK